MQNRWVLRSKSDKDQINTLAEELNFPVEIACLLLQRKIDTFDKTKLFFKPSLDELHDPFLMKDMEIATERILLAIEKKEKILIYGDYDVDGTTSVAMFYMFLHSFYEKVEYYIPDRYQEGYGVSYQGVDYAIENNFSLIITLDCGIKEVEKVLYAKENQIDFIVCDHHLPGEILPPAVANLDPQRPDCEYPCKHLSGCGVGFKLMQALSQKKNISSPDIYSYLDLVAISIAADIVPLIEENRILTYFGLRQLIEKPRVGLKFFLPKEVRETFSVSNIVFGIAPKINAAGRISHAHNAVELLISQNEIEARRIYSQINELNNERRELDANITTEAILEIKKTGQTENYSTVVYNKNWHKGVIGIVASRLIEEYYRPTLVFTEGKNDDLVASARSVVGFDIYSALERTSEYLEQFGGHMYAAGLTLKKENFIPFKEKFETIVKETIKENQRTPVIEIDEEISLKSINKRFFKLIHYFEPFGPGNLRPVFLAKNVSFGGYFTLMGREKEHLKMTVFQDNLKNSFEVIAFKMGHLIHKFEKYPFDMVFSLYENFWQGKTFYQLQIKDVLFKEE
ncbi:single-stranded-DNA-specific exonuclease RecJ [Apibacter muscae]|uniref:single-stranded-DNA-specific exonuclease RecJ n=1 Tax=Apibacter muscae TaxID=2509004 RepID=UPI0011AC613F|nr:single-stranded-DNA-specific exonuclease RecJ [Apibacter muscae]TWP30878.1 single-stranded-DNA-specific exonuclease RecJ [Apibacter muscae]